MGHYFLGEIVGDHMVSLMLLEVPKNDTWKPCQPNNVHLMSTHTAGKRESLKCSGSTNDENDCGSLTTSIIHATTLISFVN